MSGRLHEAQIYKAQGFHPIPCATKHDEGMEGNSHCLYQ
jgi:hypothetical protein